MNPDPATQEKFKEVTAAYEVLSDPQKRRMYDLGGDPFTAAASAAPVPGRASPSPTSWTPSSAASRWRRGRRAGPRPRTRRGQDALIRLDVDLAEAAFGTTRELKVDTAVLCTTCTGEGAAPGSHPVPCEICHGRGETIHLQRSFLGEVRTMRPCPACRGFGTMIPEPCRECAGDGRVRSRRTLTVKIPPAWTPAPGCSSPARARSAPAAGRPATCTSRSHVDDHPVFTRHGDDLHCTVTMPMTAAALGTTIELPTLEADVATPGSDVETRCR